MRELREPRPPPAFHIDYEGTVGGVVAVRLEGALTALDEIRAPQHLARAQVVVKLHDEHVVLWKETLTVDRPVAEAEGGDLAVETVQALGEAMQAVVDQIADGVVRELEARR